ncbi:MAG: response regulator [Acidobacteria bacterium]|nr:response regulator [Acidobacteriota bacterium]
MVERILIVDDEETICEIISSMLVGAGYECQATTSGVEALAWLRSGAPFDLIVSDMMRPGLDGPALLERVLAEFPAIPLIFATSVYDHSIALAALRNGARGYLNKPFEPGELLFMVSRVLETHRIKAHTGPDKSEFDLWTTARSEQLRKTLLEMEGVDEEKLGHAWRQLDTYGEQHRQQVAAFAAGVGRAMNLSKEQISGLARGAFIHDVGQISAFRDLLLDSGKLLPHELAALCRGCNDAYAILKTIPGLKDVAETVYAYQECFDGTGHPRGLKGSQIPLEARIITVVHGMITANWGRGHRDYARSIASVKEEMQRRSGRQYDPEIVEAILPMSADDWEDVDAETRLMRW